MENIRSKLIVNLVEPEWNVVLAKHFKTNEVKNLLKFISQEYLTKEIYPISENIFRAFNLTPFSQVKVVIIGQDPYHNPDQAHGLCFSVPSGTPSPPSLKNIYKEIENDCGLVKDRQSGDLTSWTKQGVFLLNAILSVIAHEPTSHRGVGWDNFTDQVIKTLSEKKDHLVFMLWGNYARSKKNLIDSSKHLILEAPHPSPLSAYNGFFGSHHFSKCNQKLKEWQKKEITW